MPADRRAQRIGDRTKRLARTERGVVDRDLQPALAGIRRDLAEVQVDREEAFDKIERLGKQRRADLVRAGGRVEELERQVGQAVIGFIRPQESALIRKGGTGG